jgi:hypothetical protein
MEDVDAGGLLPFLEQNASGRESLKLGTREEAFVDGRDFGAHAETIGTVRETGGDSHYSRA